MKTFAKSSAIGLSLFAASVAQAQYLPNADLQADALIDGVTAANPDGRAVRLLADDTRIMSF